MNYTRLFNSRVVNYLSSCFLLLSSSVMAADAAEKADEKSKIFVTHAISVYGEPKYAADFKHFDYASPKAIKGGTFRERGMGTFDSLNPYIINGTPAERVSMIYDSLVATSMDEPASIYGLVAEKFEYPEDRSWIIYHLNPKAHFHDGKKITSEDVVFSFNILISKGAPLIASYWSDVEGIEALDSHRVKFTFKNTKNREILLAVGGLPILPKHYWKDREFDRTSLDIPLGSGPYKIKKIDAGRSITYERVKDYWAKDLPVNVGSYNFDEYIIDYYRDDNVAIEALKAGKLDFRWERIAKSWLNDYETPAVKQGLLKKQTIRDYSPRGMQGFVMNLRKPPFDNIKFRQALNYAYDFEWTNKTIFSNAYKRINSYFSNSDMASTGLPQGRELEILNQFKDQLPNEVFTEVFKNPVTDGSGNNRENLRKAQELLTQAGYKIVNGKLIDPATQKPVVIELIETDSTFDRVLNPYSQNLKRLGIELNIRQVDTSQYYNRVRNHDFDMTTLALIQYQLPGNEQRDRWSSKAADTQGSGNYMGIKNPVVDELVEMLINSPSLDELKYRTRALDRVLLHNHYVILQHYSNEHRLVYWDKFGQPDIAPAFDRTFDTAILTWWIDPQKEKRLEAKKKSL